MDRMWGVLFLTRYRHLTLTAGDRRSKRADGPVCAAPVGAVAGWAPHQWGQSGKTEGLFLPEFNNSARPTRTMAGWTHVRPNCLPRPTPTSWDVGCARSAFLADSPRARWSATRCRLPICPASRPERVGPR